jgi:choline dehydrogenase-like flavoprotein
MLGDIGGLAAGAYRKIFKPLPNQFHTRFWSECAPDADSRITLGNETDALGLRRVKLDWRLPAELERTYRRAHELLADELQRHGIGRLTIGMDGSVAKALAHAESSYHHMGATRMHESPRKGVVDANSKVHDVNNLFIAGSSVFPTYGHINPTLTIVALAVRLADHIKQECGVPAYAH